MTKASVAPTVAQRVESASRETLYRQRAVASARHERESVRNRWLALVLFFVLTIGLSFAYYPMLPHSEYYATRLVKSGDPFAADKVGQVRMPYKRDTCRRFEFDNEAATMSKDSIALCDWAATASSDTSSQTPLESISNAFKR